MTDAAVRAHVRLAGHVQGVGFRFSIADQVRRSHVAGWVRNVEAGGVEAVFEGPRPAVEAIVHWCQLGPSGAWVRELKVAWDEPLEGLTGFDIRRSV